MVGTKLHTLSVSSEYEAAMDSLSRVFDFSVVDLEVSGSPIIPALCLLATAVPW